MPSTWFPNLKNYVVTSSATPQYNCIAWAFGENTRWWWPDADGFAYWPKGYTRKETIEAFDEFLFGEGAVTSDDQTVEQNYVKIALFAKNGIPTHASRQLPNGMWTSKLGMAEDIAHHLTEIESDDYGQVVKIYAVPVTRPASPTA